MASYRKLFSDIIKRKGYWGVKTWPNKLAYLVLVVLVVVPIPVSLTRGLSIARCKSAFQKCSGLYANAVYDGQGRAWDSQGNLILKSWDEHGREIAPMDRCFIQRHKCISPNVPILKLVLSLFVVGVVGVPLYLKQLAVPPGAVHPFFKVWKYLRGDENAFEEEPKMPDEEPKYLIIMSRDGESLRIPLDSPAAQRFLQQMSSRSTYKSTLPALPEDELGEGGIKPSTYPRTHRGPRSYVSSNSSDYDMSTDLRIYLGEGAPSVGSSRATDISEIEAWTEGSRDGAVSTADVSSVRSARTR